MCKELMEIALESENMIPITKYIGNFNKGRKCMKENQTET